MIQYLCFFLASLAGNQSDIDYIIYEDGPRTIYEGTARLYADEKNLYPCLSYCFDVPKGRLAGPVTSSNPGQPMLAFDWWEELEDGLEVLWCRNSLPTHPFTGEDLQNYPISIPRNFIFYIIKTEFDGDDLTKMLDEWNSEDSAWDLNLDGFVDGADLSILLAGWKID
jgi:hypothetical protein|tara:strand:+ start:52 stop:555 length:504 start_codon:yes stop_codon:yes gene_type:complete